MEQGIRIYVGNEAEIASPLLDSEVGYKLSERYVFMDLDKDTEDISLDDPESFKLEYIINHIPLAERFAFSFFEDISFKNFLLTRSFVERMNLLNKVSASSNREIEFIASSDFAKQLSSGFKVSFDTKRANLLANITDVTVGDGRFQGTTGQNIGAPQGTGATIAERTVSIAISQVGTKEVGGNNRGPKVEEYLRFVGLGAGDPWCAAGLSWCVNEACKQLNLVNKFHSTGGTHDLLAWAEGAGFSIAHPTIQQISVGDIGFVDRGGGHGHAWIVVGINGDQIDTVHFNSRDAGVPGGGVARKNLSTTSFDATIKWYNAFK
jgi:hypothetical protein